MEQYEETKTSNVLDPYSHEYHWLLANLPTAECARLREWETTEVEKNGRYEHVWQWMAASIKYKSVTQSGRSVEFVIFAENPHWREGFLTAEVFSRLGYYVVLKADEERVTLTVRW